MVNARRVRGKHALMVLGTASDVGKSMLVAALCRIFAQDGWRVAPFKAQNMSLNSAATPDGREIGRAQALQAEAARIQPTVDMNPILLKPTSDRESQVVVLGRVWKNLSAHDYHRAQVEALFPTVLAAYRRLAAAHDIVVLEGAGSPAEINLKAHDIVNLRMAEAADARCVLVGDVDRGGVFAALLGTLELLEPHERPRIRAFVVNKFRGERSLLDDGIVEIEHRLNIPCAGVVPWLEDIGLDDEDSVVLERRPRVGRLGWRYDDDPVRPLRVAVVGLPHLANFTDFDALAAESSVDLGYARSPEELEYADLIVLPGTKSTVDDLTWLRTNGLAQAILRAAERIPILGICGGMQMLGRTITDPHGIEGGASSAGLGLLEIDTVFGTEKVTIPIRGRFAERTLFGIPVDAGGIAGYEIHVGLTTAASEIKPLLRISREGGEGLVADGAVDRTGRVIGTYVHGLFAEDSPRHAFVQAARAAARLAPPARLAAIATERETRIDRLADHVRASLDLDVLLSA